MKEYLEASASDLVIGFRIRIHRRQEIHSGSAATNLPKDHTKTANLIIKRDSSQPPKKYESVTEEYRKLTTMPLPGGGGGAESMEEEDILVLKLNHTGKREESIRNSVRA